MRGIEQASKEAEAARVKEAEDAAARLAESMGMANEAVLAAKAAQEDIAAQKEAMKTQQIEREATEAVSITQIDEENSANVLAIEAFLEKALDKEGDKEVASCRHDLSIAVCLTATFRYSTLAERTSHTDRFPDRGVGCKTAQRMLCCEGSGRRCRARQTVCAPKLGKGAP